jgi:hypothetical protein
MELTSKFLVACPINTPRIGETAKENTLTSSNSALRALNRSRWLVTMGNIEVSADEVKGMGVLRVVLPDDSPFLFLVFSKPRSSPSPASASSTLVPLALGGFAERLSSARRSVSSFSLRDVCLESSARAVSSLDCVDLRDSSRDVRSIWYSTIVSGCTLVTPMEER